MLKPLKDFSPMGLAWTYMGYSKGFNIFTGGLEVLGGLLLIPRRTQTLGALVVAGIMTHVAAMNFMFDIPVKLFSVHLVLMALLIFSTDIKRFVNVFITNKPTDTYNYFRPTRKPYYNKLTLGLKVILTLYFMYSFSASGMKNVKKWGDEREKPNLYGIWETNYFIKNNDTIPATFKDNKRWQHLIIDYKGDAMVTKLNRKKNRIYTFTSDSINKTISMYFDKEDSVSHNFKYYHPNKDFLQLKGTLDNDTLDIILSRVDHTKFRLNSRGFNWINERPYNR